MNKLILIIAGVLVAQGASAKIGETREQILQRENGRKQEIVAFRDEQLGGKPALMVDYKDGSTIGHVFGVNGREIVTLFDPNRALLNEDITTWQGVFPTTWRVLERDGSSVTWISKSNLEMVTTRKGIFICDRNKEAEVKAFQAKFLSEEPEQVPAAKPAASPEDNDSASSSDRWLGGLVTPSPSESPARTKSPGSEWPGKPGANETPEVNPFAKFVEPLDFETGLAFYTGDGHEKNFAKAVRWFRKAAEKNDARAQFYLGLCYVNGEGARKNYAEAVKWFRKAAEQNVSVAQYNLGLCYAKGEGLRKNYAEAVKWYRKAAEQNYAGAQLGLGLLYGMGKGVPKNDAEAYRWLLLAAAQGNEDAEKWAATIEKDMSRGEIAEGQKLARDFTPRQVPPEGAATSGITPAKMRPMASGTGFFITEDGYLITSGHVVANGTLAQLVTASGLISAKVMKVDPANDLAVLKANGKFEALPVAASRTTKLGGTVVTVGFPNIGLQGFEPKYSRGEIASLTGLQDDARFFQISVPLQPGNSGGALVDEHGNVVGVVSAKLSAAAAFESSGALPENVNYAVKSSFLLGFLESVPDAASKLKEPNTSDMKSDEVVEKAKGAAVLVLVY